MIRFVCFLVSYSLYAQSSTVATGFNSKDRQPTQAELATIPPVFSKEKADSYLKEIRFPEEFETTIFATPPAVNYPVFVSTSVDGVVYVSSDGNGSLDRKPNLGRVLRVRDTNNDGKADEVKAFVPNVDSPRGLVWDHDRLYLLHPPHISVFIDHNGDGISDEQKILVKNIAFTFKDRPADHSSNGLEMGIDGWLYAAIGDFGFLEAEGTDGRKLQLRAGGVVRVRPDGTGLELYSRGMRNILEAAVSPLLDLFARDNTNDGGGWDVRFHHIGPLGEHGYPALFKNFGAEIIQPLADYGGGSGCGAAWIDEPGIPSQWNKAPLTADWGREKVYRHRLTSSGATFTDAQAEFCTVPRVTDLDVDGLSQIFFASWKGASFTWVGPDVGFLVRATPKSYQPPPLPNFHTLNDVSLIQILEGPSHRRRMEAQRTLLRRGLKPTTVKGLSQLASNSTKPLESRVAAIFALKQGLGSASVEILAKLSRDPILGAWAIRALTDRWDELGNVPEAPIVSATLSPDPRTRREAAVAIARLGAIKPTESLVPLLDDKEEVIVHTAVKALVQTRAIHTCLGVVDSNSASPRTRAGALRALQSMHEPDVVSQLLNRLANETASSRREGLITTLCRLHFQDATWNGDSWGTRPDTRGPYYQPAPWGESDRIATTLKTLLAKADPIEAAFVGRELAKHRIPLGDAMDTLITRAKNEISLLPAVASQLAEQDQIPPTAIPLLTRIAIASDTQDATRAQAVIALSKTPDPEAWRAVVQAFPRTQRTKTENNLAEKARNAVNNSPSLENLHATFESIAQSTDPEQNQLATGFLLKIVNRKSASQDVKASAEKTLSRLWESPSGKVQIMKAASSVNEAGKASWFVAALQDPDKAVAEQATQTVKRLKIDPAKFHTDSTVKKVGELPIEEALAAAVKLKGDPNRGDLYFQQAGCVACHTTRPNEPLKGPYLGNIAATYKRHELAEAILLPNKTLAQGFVANRFEMADDSEIDGFVVQEAADFVTIRTITAQEMKLKVSEIKTRTKLQKSLMPDGLVNALSVSEFASILDFLQSLTESK